ADIAAALRRRVFHTRTLPGQSVPLSIRRHAVLTAWHNSSQSAGYGSGRGNHAPAHRQSRPLYTSGLEGNSAPGWRGDARVRETLLAALSLAVSARSAVRARAVRAPAR